MNINYVQFEPWVGSNYWAGCCYGKKILILGESHYGSDYSPKKTVDLLNDQANSNWTHKTYTKFERALTGFETNEKSRNEIWNEVAFYNYIQDLLPTPDDKPTQKQWDSGINAFYEVLNELQPDVLLVWGDRLWSHLPESNYTWDCDLECHGAFFNKGHYTLANGHEVNAYAMDHPGRAFSWNDWHQFFRNFVYD
ncbi:MAG: UDP-N-acetyl glucosamine 2-epimerase [Treponemataceae bacterium]|nr:UDP-N-acetyl glucosamine 2-epimerase [Treponemataceae bacterium]